MSGWTRRASQNSLRVAGLPNLTLRLRMSALRPAGGRHRLRTSQLDTFFAAPANEYPSPQDADKEPSLRGLAAPRANFLVHVVACRQ
uniref:Uncharacterized protein n=1 Tax=Panagrellus redivivus TaxID=6233 RepID=A0A7E4UYZ6_PANRE